MRNKQVYKYTKLKYIKSAFEYGIFASRLEQLNDPYEIFGIKYTNKYRVCCTSSSSRKMLMWSHYSRHSGCVVIFENPIYDSKEVLKEIDYTDKLIDFERMKNDNIVEYLMSKGKEWAYEKEMRAVYYSDSNEKYWIKKGNEVYLRAKVKGIIFGLYSDREDEYLDSLKLIKDYNDELDCEIEVKKCMLSRKKYEIILDPQFDYKEEIKKINRKK